MTAPVQTVLPRWRGFNLLEMVNPQRQGPFREEDFAGIAELGFDFVRLPLDYRLLTRDGQIGELLESGLAEVDRAVELGRQYGLHVSVNLMRAPGYCVNPAEAEPFNLWKDEAALDAFCLYWSLLARRYRGRPSAEVSFDLVNEPPSPAEDGDLERMTRADHERVVRAAVAAIRAVDPEGLILADGLYYGKRPVPELADLGIAESCRAYDPMAISHAGASWVPSESWPPPAWPMEFREEHWDRARLEVLYQPWRDLAAQGVGVHCGEGGCFKQTPHPLFLTWFRDVLEILTGAGIGYALWNFRGAFGILDSGREDVAYEDWHGHQLDRALLELLQEF
jgi:endoglucanase